MCEADEVMLAVCCRVAPDQLNHPTLDMVDHTDLAAGRVEYNSVFLDQTEIGQFGFFPLGFIATGVD